MNIAKIFTIVCGLLGGFVLLFNLLEASEIVGAGIILGIFGFLFIWSCRSRQMKDTTKWLLGTCAGVIFIPSSLWFTEVLIDEHVAPEWTTWISILCYLVVALILIDRSKQMDDTLQVCLFALVFSMIIYVFIHFFQFL